MVGRLLVLVAVLVSKTRSTITVALKRFHYNQGSFHSIHRTYDHPPSGESDYDKAMSTFRKEGDSGADISQYKSVKEKHHIAITNLWEMQFFGELEIGTPPQKLKVVFDTGSGHLVVKGRHCKSFSGGSCQDTHGLGYDFRASSSYEPSSRVWHSHYGSGSADGKNVRDTISIGGYKATGMLVAVSEREADKFAKFQFDGIFGLGMIVEQGHRQDLFAKIIEQNPEMDPVYAMYISNEPNSEGSELSIGGYDAGKVADGASWQFVSVLPFPYGVYNYWAARMPFFQMSGGKQFCAGYGGCNIIIDSGTTFISIDRVIYNQAMAPVLKDKHCKFEVSQLSYVCFSTAKAITYDDFPTLKFGFGGDSNAPDTMFELHPKEYIDCKVADLSKLEKLSAKLRKNPKLQQKLKNMNVCRPRLKKHISRENLRFWIFGDFFIRKYYSMFDHGKKQLGFACAKGIEGCRIPPVPDNDT